MELTIKSMEGICSKEEAAQAKKAAEKVFETFGLRPEKCFQAAVKYSKTGRIENMSAEEQHLLDIWMLAESAALRVMHSEARPDSRRLGASYRLAMEGAD